MIRVEERLVITGETLAKVVDKLIQVDGNLNQLDNRVVRVEEELKNQRELMMQGFANSDKRFEVMQIQMDRRFDESRIAMKEGFERVDRQFEAINKKFFFMATLMGLGFTAIIVSMAVFKFLSS